MLLSCNGELRYLQYLQLLYCRKEDYDLCSFCFGQMGNEEDYIRLDHPLTYNKRPIHCKGSFEVVCLFQLFPCIIYVYILILTSVNSTSLVVVG